MLSRKPQIHAPKHATATATGNRSKDKKGKQLIQNSLNRKKSAKKTNLAMSVIVAIVGIAVFAYTVFKYRDVLAQGGAAGAKALGPWISRLLPAIIVGLTSTILGPEATPIGGIVGAVFGPQLLALAGSLVGGSTSAAIAATPPIADAAVL